MKTNHTKITMFHFVKNRRSLISRPWNKRDMKQHEHYNKFYGENIKVYVLVIFRFQIPTCCYLCTLFTTFVLNIMTISCDKKTIRKHELQKDNGKTIPSRHTFSFSKEISTSIFYHTLLNVTSKLYRNLS